MYCMADQYEYISPALDIFVALIPRLENSQNELTPHRIAHLNQEFQRGVVL